MKIPSSLKLALTCGFAFATLAACGSKSSIDLQKPPTPEIPAPPANQKPGADPSQNPDDPNTNPEKPDLPVEQGPKQARYNLVCQGHSTPFETIESTATNTAGSYTLYLGHFDDPTKQVTSDNKNINSGSNPIAISGAAPDRLDFLFMGVQQVSKDHDASPRLYEGTIDLIQRTGPAVDLGPGVQIDKSTRQSAQSMGLAAANYGASDDGNFLLIPSGGSYKVLSRDRSITYGTIAVNPANSILPKIFESRKVFTALVSNGHGFSPVLKTLSFTSSSVSVASTINLGNSQMAASPLQNYDASSLAWSESPSVDGGKTIVIATVNIATGKVTRATYTSTSGKIFPQIAVINSADNVTHTINLAIEATSPKTLDPNAPTDITGGAGVSVAYAKIQQLILNGSELRDAGTLDYPALAVAQADQHGLRNGKWIVHSLFTTENSDVLLGTFNAYSGTQLFANRQGLFDGVGQSICTLPSVTEENL